MTAPVLVLASSSPRRRDLLTMLGIPVLVQAPDVLERRLPREEPEAYARRLAREKARAVPGHLVLGADTIVVLEGEILEKPTDAADAVTMLRRLRGRRHEVITAVALQAGGTLREAVDRTTVTFRPVSDAWIDAYVGTGEPMDKAGAYGIQGYGAGLVEGIEGDFFSVMGLPLRLLIDLLGQAGCPYLPPAPGSGSEGTTR